MEKIVFIAALVIVIAWVLLLAYALGRKQGRLSCAHHVERADRYMFAVDSLDRWCGFEFPQARLIAAHLLAEGEGLAMNAGTPLGDEPCTLPGLREQLRRIARHSDVENCK